MVLSISEFSFQVTSTTVYAYTIDAASTSLTAVPGSPFTAGENPVSAAVDVSGTFLFVSINTNTANGNSVPAFLLIPTLALSRLCRLAFRNVAFPRVRHSYSTLLRANGTDMKVQSELLRHSNIGTTLSLYTQAVSEQKRVAHGQVVRQLPAV